MIFSISQRENKTKQKLTTTCKEWKHLSYRACRINETIRDAKDTTSERIAFVCSIN